MQEERSADLPDSVIIARLRREVLLTRAKLHGLMYDHIMSERRLRSLKTQLRQVGSASGIRGIRIHMFQGL